MKSWKKALSGVLAGVMILSSVIAVGAANVSFTDTGSHWAKNQITYLVSKDVLNGYKQSNGTYIFKPDGTVTRAEFIKMLDETFGLTATIGISYNDVKTSDWFHPYFSKAAAQGYLLNYGSSVNPNGQLTREEATTLLVRYLGIQDGQKAPASTFADYNKISSHFQGPVMAAVYAGLITGYQEKGATYFKPQGTLTRAEALTILYRAAGAIYKTSAYSKDSGAPDSNTTITRGDVTVSGMILNGRVIITEGVSGGTVTLTGCTVSGNLEIRGAANLIFDKCNITSAVLNSVAPTINISLSGGTTVSTLELLTPASMNISTGCKVNNLLVEADSKNLRVMGDGSIEDLILNATGFVSTMMPKNFSIASGISANFANQPYTGSSDDQASFVNVPYMTEENNKYVLHVTPEETGRVYYYYTKQSYTPSAGEYMSAYSAANTKGSFNVQSGAAYGEITANSSDAEEYSYVIIQLVSSDRTYAPVVIENTATSGTGFYINPYYDGKQISYQSEIDGTLYYYYSDDGDALSAEEFQRNYNRADSDNRYTKNVTADRDASISLSSSTLEDYPFVIFALQGKNGQYYIPVVVAAGDNGFDEEPAVTTIGTIEYVTSVDGTLYYYYTKDESMPTPQYVSNYWRTEYKGTYTSVNRNRTGSITYDPDVAEMYPYMVLCIKDKNGDFLTPVLLKVDLDTGFSVQPYVSATDEITFRSEHAGTVYWYFSRTSSIPSMKDFLDEWRSTPSGRSGSEPVSSTNYKSFIFDPDYISTYPYIVIMLVDADDNTYQPVLVDVKNTTTTGFNGEPYCDLSNERVYFYPNGEGEVYYYFSPATSAYSETVDEFWDSYTSHSETGRSSVNKSLQYIDFDDISSTYRGVMLMFVDAADREHYPVYVSIMKDTSSGNSEYGVTLMKVEDYDVTFYAHVSGTIEYALRGSGGWTRDYEKTVSKGQTFTISASSSYRELYVKMPGYNELNVDLTKDYDRDDTTGDGSNMSGTGLTNTRYDSQDYVFSGYAIANGTLSLYVKGLVDENNPGSSLASIEVSRYEAFELEIPEIIKNLMGSSFGANIVGDAYVQLTTDDGDVYEKFPISLGD